MIYLKLLISGIMNGSQDPVTDEGVRMGNSDQNSIPQENGVSNDYDTEHPPSG